MLAAKIWKCCGSSKIFFFCISALSVHKNERVDSISVLDWWVPKRFRRRKMQQVPGPRLRGGARSNNYQPWSIRWYWIIKKIIEEKRHKKPSGRLLLLWFKAELYTALASLTQGDMRKSKVIAKHFTLLETNCFYKGRKILVVEQGQWLRRCMSSSEKKFPFMWSADIPSNAWRTE